MPTPFKIKAALDCSAVTVYDEEEEEAEEHDLELPELTLEGEEETVIATNNSVSPDADSNESLEAHFATCRSEFPDFPEIPTDGKISNLFSGLKSIIRMFSTFTVNKRHQASF